MVNLDEITGDSRKQPKAAIDRLLGSIREFRAVDISHDELGVVNGFHEAQELKTAISDYFIELLEILLEVVDDVDASVRETVIKRINDEGESLRSIEESINRLAKEGVHTQDFPNARTAEIRSLRERGGAVKLQLQPYEGVIRAKRLERRLDAHTLDKLETSGKERLAELERLVAEATKALGNLQTHVMAKAVDVAVSTFTSIAKAHARQERNWFYAFLCVAAATIFTLLFIVFSTDFPSNGLHFAAVLFRRLLLVSVPAVFARVTLAKYNLERNLRIIYEHREAVLAQFRVFESAIGDDTAAKNQFRLEIAKYIFSDPVTGYVNSDVSSEINISPMVALLEKAAGR